MNPPLQLITRQPVEQRTTMAFVDRRDDSAPYGLRGSFEEVTLPTFAPSPSGERLRKSRVMVDLSIGDAARTLGITAAELSGLEHGRYDLSAEDWDRVFDAIEWTATP